MATNLKAKGVQASDGGTVLLRYVGKSQGTQAFYGPKSGKMYEAGLSRPLIPVQSRDLHSGRLSTPGLLDIRESGRALFMVEPPAKPQAVPVQEPLPEAVEEIVAEIIAAEPDELPVVDVSTVLLADTAGISARTAEKLNDAGITTAQELAAGIFDLDELAVHTGLSKATLERAVEKAKAATA